MGLMLKENKLNVNSYFYGQVKKINRQDRVQVPGPSLTRSP